MPGIWSGRTGGMKRVKIVLSGWRRARVVATGKTLSIHGGGQELSAENIRCLSTHKWTVRSVGGSGNS